MENRLVLTDSDCKSTDDAIHMPSPKRRKVSYRIIPNKPSDLFVDVGAVRVSCEDLKTLVTGKCLVDSVIHGFMESLQSSGHLFLDTFFVNFVDIPGDERMR